MRLFAFFLVLLVLLPSLAAAQFTVSSTVPVNGATGVALNTTVSITFSSAADTTKPFFPGGSFLTNANNASDFRWSVDKKTFSFDAALDSNKIYFVVIFTAFPAAGGTLTTAYGFQFTTSAAFPGNLYSVSGTLSGGTTGVSPANAIVGLSSNGLGGNQGPDLVAGSVTDAGGNFVIPYVPAGNWSLVAAKDVNGDGDIQPSTGDVLGIGTTVNVTNANITGLNIVFQSFPPMTFLAAKDSASAYAALNLPADFILRGAQGQSIDSLGHAAEWSFYFNTPENPTPKRLRVEPFQISVDSNAADWMNIGTARLLNHLSSAALSDTFFANIERQGGRAFRLANPKPDSLEFWASAKIGDLRSSEYGWMIPDTSKNYWGATYAFQRTVTKDSTYQYRTKYFLGDFNTGALIAMTSVDEPVKNMVPVSISLDQNYPNPFNPTTVISGQWSVTSVVRLAVYDILGREVAVVANGRYPAGKYSFTFNASTLSSGIYFYRLTAGSFTAVKKMSLIK